MMLSSPTGMHGRREEGKYHQRVSQCCSPDTMDWRNFGFVTRVKEVLCLCHSHHLYTLTGEESRSAL